MSASGPIVPVCSVHGERLFNPDCKECQWVRGEMRRIARMLRKVFEDETPR